MIPKHFAENPQAYDLWQAYTFLSGQTEHDWTFGFPASLSFPASEVEALRDEDGELRLDVNLPGLTGANGPLPHPLIETVIQERHEGNRALQEFFDLLQNRLMLLWLEDAEEMCPELGRIKDGEGFFPEAAYPMSAAGLEMVLEKERGVKVEVEQFRGAWVDMPENYRTRLGTANTQLGKELILGKMAFDSCDGISLQGIY